MWQAVRRELARLEWDAAPPQTPDLLSDWTQTVQHLLAVRRTLGPVPADDPLALLATATTGATRVPGVRPIPAPALSGVSRALAAVADTSREGVLERGRDVATLNHVAYELAHWVRVRATDQRTATWLLAGETALDGAIHAPTARTSLGVGLAAWQHALAAVQPVPDIAIVQRSVALGHLGILRTTHTLVSDARQAGALPTPYADALLRQVRDLARVHQATLSRIDERQLGSTRVDQAVMLKVGLAVRQLTARPDPSEPTHNRLDALLRTSVGEAVIVAQLTRAIAAQPITANISRLSLEYLADPSILKLVPPPSVEPAASARHMPTPRLSSAPPQPTTQGVPSTIDLGTVLRGSEILALCRARDLGVAAAAGDPTHPPEILRGVDTARWPQLVVDGRQAVADLVTSVAPMVYAQTRHVPDAADLRGQMFVELMNAAHRFDPLRASPEHWHSYAWITLDRSRRRGVDPAGVAHSRSSITRPATLTLDGREPASRAVDPARIVEERAGVAAITDALARLPASLRTPLLDSMQGQPARAVAENSGVSETTARRRIEKAREHIKAELARQGRDEHGIPSDSATHPALERSQRLNDATFVASRDPTLGRGPAL